MRTSQVSFGSTSSTSRTQSITSAMMASACGTSKDGFFYDVLHTPGGNHVPMCVRSMVGLIPLFAVETLEPGIVNKLPGFRRRLEWFIQNRKDLTRNVACMETAGEGE